MEFSLAFIFEAFGFIPNFIMKSSGIEIQSAIPSPEGPAAVKETDHFQTCTLPRPNRYITTHDDQSGKAIYSDTVPEPVSFWHVGPKNEPAAFGLGYVTDAMPVRLTRNQDLTDFYHGHRRRKQSGLVNRGGSVLRYVDYPPRASSPMHRTVSCDYAVVLFGKMECLLDSGERRTLNPGDTLIQRGTMHQWINLENSWSRMLYVLLDATPVDIHGEQLCEELGGMERVLRSR